MAHLVAANHDFIVLSLQERASTIVVLLRHLLSVDPLCHQLVIRALVVLAKLGTRGALLAVLTHRRIFSDDLGLTDL